MGWLKEKAEAAGLTFTDLGEAMLKARRAESRFALRTVTNGLGNADKGKGGWLLTGNGKEFRAPLAKLLGLSAAELHASLSAPPAEGGQSLEFEIEPFPEVRLDLMNDESFMPGFPPELTREEGPRIERAWWVVADDSGSWVARWLQARFGWTRVSLRRWSPTSLPARGRAFVELGSSEGMTEEWVKDVPPSLQICVACSDPPPSSKESRAPKAAGAKAEAPTWTELRFPPSAEWLEELVDWVAKRVAPDGGFTRESALRLARKEYGDTAATPADVLAFFALIDAEGERAFDSDRRRLLRRWVRRAEERFAVEPGSGISRRADQFLLDLELARLRAVKPGRLSADAWAALLSSSGTPNASSEAVALIKKGKSQEAIALLESDGQSHVDALQRCGVLRATREMQLELHPPWLARTVGDIAFEDLWARDELDVLMLNESTSAKAIRRVIDELRHKNEGRIKRWLARGSSESSARWLAKCDGIFRAVGFALTIPGVDVPVDIVRAVWDIYDGSSQRYPMDVHRPPTPWVSVGGSSGLQSEAAHYLAAAAISLRLKLPPSALSPTVEWIEKDKWAAEQAATRVFKGMRDAVAAEPVGSDEALAPYRLADKLLDQIWIDHRLWELNLLQQPAMFARAVGSDRFGGRFGSQPFNWAAMRDACDRHRVSMKSAVESAWATHDFWFYTAALNEQPFSETEAQLLFSAVSAARLHALDTKIKLEKPDFGPITLPWMSRPDAWPHLKAEVWEYWMNHEGGVSEQMLEAMPEPFALRLLQWNWSHFWRGRNASALTRVLWRRFPVQVVERLIEAAESGERWGVLEMVAQNAPDNQCAVVIEKLTRANDDDLRFWLVDVVSNRRPGWQRAAELLAEPVRVPPATINPTKETKSPRSRRRSR